MMKILSVIQEKTNLKPICLIYDAVIIQAKTAEEK